MQRTGKNPAAIVSKRVIPSHQIASIIQQHGWTSDILDRCPCPEELRASNPKMLIVDIDDASCHGIGILQWFRQHNPLSYTIALCQGGCTPSMRSARRLGVDGFFYLNASGLSLDPERGLLPVFLQMHKIKADAPHESRSTIAMPGRNGMASSIGY